MKGFYVVYRDADNETITGAGASELAATLAAFDYHGCTDGPMSMRPANFQEWADRVADGSGFEAEVILHEVSDESPNEEKAAYIIGLATGAAKRSGNDSAFVGLADAIECHKTHRNYYAAQRALSSLRYSVGIFSPVHAEAKSLADTIAR